MTFDDWWVEYSLKIRWELCFDDIVAAWTEAEKHQRKRCLAICAKYASVEGVAQKIADEIERGE